MGNALRNAAQDLKHKLIEAATEVLEARAEDLVIEGNRINVRGSPGIGLSWGEVVERSDQDSLTGQADFTTKGGLDPETNRGVASVHWHQGVGAAAVEIDEETGQIRVTDFHAATYAGQVVNPTTAALQTEGNVVMGLGVTLGEELIYDGGQIVNANFGDYLIPSMADIPDKLTTTEMEDPQGDGDLHGISESTIPTIAPAIANAVAAATGIRVLDLPLTAEKILRKLNNSSLIHIK